VVLSIAATVVMLALGARKGQVLRLVLRESVALIAVGTVLGLLGAIAMSKILSALTDQFADAFKVGANDLRLLVGAPLLLAGLTLLASYVPARTAAKVDPLLALREGRALAGSWAASGPARRF
jgi:putative ABC transport system permease protein